MKHRMIRSIAIALLLFCFMNCCLTGCSSDEDSNDYNFYDQFLDSHHSEEVKEEPGSQSIRTIQTGAFNNHKDVEIADGFEQFFGKVKWSYDSESGCVYATGDALYNNKGATFIMRFTFQDAHSFSMSHVKVVEKESGKTTMITDSSKLGEFIDVIFESAKPPVSSSDGGSTSHLPNGERCSVCGGDGYCTEACLNGTCTGCLGSGMQDCSKCVGGRCTKCGGAGETTDYVGGDIKTRRCTYCSGSGNCTRCKGTAEEKCHDCYGSGSCTVCHGSGKCTGCRGAGKA